MDSETDYELSQDTPYSTQKVPGKSSPLDLSPVKQFKYDSVPRNNATNAYKSYMWDFNPLSEIHASWQDTIHEESFEDEELLSSPETKKIRSAINDDHTVRSEYQLNGVKQGKFVKQTSSSHAKLPQAKTTISISYAANTKKKTSVTGKTKA